MKLPLHCLALGLVSALAATSCRNPSSTDAAAVSPAATPSGPSPVVTGTVLDARSGKPIAGALVRGPGGAETKSDARGRFVLRGLSLGVSGDLVATSPSGLAGKNTLRALESGPLEVVLHLR